MRRSVVFVDDELNILEALQRMLRPLRMEWDMQFVRCGTEALNLMATTPMDVMITDMRMPGMDGDELLSVVRQRFPQTVRIVLTGQCSRNAVMRLVPLAHRILAKPFDADGLRNVLRRTHSLRDLIASPSLVSLVGNLGGLPAVQEKHTRVLEELDKPDASLTRVAALVSEDVGLVTKLMQLANSALFGLRQPVTSPAKAVQVVGAEMTRATLLAANVFDRYDPKLLAPYSIDSLWTHSREMSERACRIAQIENCGERSTDSALAGLLHDVGRLVLASQMPQEYKKVLQLVSEERLALVDAEARIVGATHAEVGAYLLGLWGLPDAIVEAVAWHHHPSRCPGDTLTPLLAVHVAEGLLGREEKTPFDMAYLERLKLADQLPKWQQLQEDSDASRKHE